MEAVHRELRPGTPWHLSVSFFAEDGVDSPDRRVTTSSRPAVFEPVRLLPITLYRAEPTVLRNLGDLPGDAPSSAFETKSGIEIKIALGNYRMFFTPGPLKHRCPAPSISADGGIKDTEDFFYRKRLPAEVVEASLHESSWADSAKKRLEAFIERERGREIPG